jgi:hypothetical protein
MRKSIEAALKPMIPASNLSMTPADYLKFLSTQLDNVRIALSRAEEAEKTPISLVEVTRPQVRVARDALLDIVNSRDFD